MWMNVKVVLRWGIANMFSLFQIYFIVLLSRKQFCSNVCRCMQGITCPLPLCCLLHRVQHHRNFYFIQYVLYKIWRCMFCMNLTKGKSNNFRIHEVGSTDIPYQMCIGLSTYRSFAQQRSFISHTCILEKDFWYWLSHNIWS